MSVRSTYRLCEPRVFYRNVLLDRIHFGRLIAERPCDDPGERERDALHIAELGIINTHDVLSDDVWLKVNEADQVTRFRIEEEPHRQAAKCRSAKLVHLLIVESDPSCFHVGDDGLQVRGYVKGILQPQRVEFVLSRVTY